MSTETSPSEHCTACRNAALDEAYAVVFDAVLKRGNGSERAKLLAFDITSSIRKLKEAPSRDEQIRRLAAYMKVKYAQETARRAALPAGMCPECNGAGEQGGQFCGGFWKCETCDGTGKKR